MSIDRNLRRKEIWSMLVKWLDENNTKGMECREVMVLFAAYYSDLKLRELKEQLFEVVMKP